MFTVSNAAASETLILKKILKHKNKYTYKARIVFAAGDAVRMLSRGAELARKCGAVQDTAAVVRMPAKRRSKRADPDYLKGLERRLKLEAALQQ